MKSILHTVIFLISIIVATSYAQSDFKTDSLYVESQLKQAKALIDETPDSALKIADNLLAYSTSKNYLLGIIRTNNLLGSIYERKTAYKKSIHHYLLASETAKKTNQERELAIALYNSAHVYQAMSDYDKAFKNTEAALYLKRKFKDSIGIARCYRQLAECLSLKGDNKLSIQYFNQAIDILRKLNANSSIASALCNLSVVYVDEKMYAQALAALNESKKWNAIANDLTQEESIYLNTGFCYDNMKQLDSAKFYYLKALQLSEVLHIEYDEIIALINLGELNLKTKNLTLAENYLLKALSLSQKVNSTIDLRDVHQKLAQLYAFKQSYQKAYYHKEAFENYSDTILNQEKMRLLEELSIKFETKELADKNKLLQNQNDLQTIKSKQKNYLIYGITLVALLICAILILYIRQNKYKTQKESLDIEQKLLQIQMNPHFIFNSLQAIQSFILTNQTQQTASYLTSFSRLMRLILENSKHEFITLDKELSTLSYYLELQKLRFKNVFNYTIIANETLDKDFIYIPPMLLQPFIENAIEHGFKNLNRVGELKFSVSVHQNTLNIEIFDNGHGIKKSQHLKEQTSHHSYALEIITKRIELLNQKQKTAIKLNIIDLSDTNKELTGTKIIVSMPIINKIK